MGVDDNKSKKIVFKLLKKFIHIAKKAWVWSFWGGLLLIASVFDCSTEPYRFPWVERVFSYEIGNLVAIVVVIWTFTVTAGMYCLSQLETKYYGVRLVDVFFNIFTFRRASAMIAAVAGEMLLLIIATILRWKITIAIIAFLQFYTTCFVFALVCLYFTRTAVILMAHEEIKKFYGKKVPFSDIEQNMKVSLKVAQNTDYDNDDEKNSLFNLLKMISDTEKYSIDNVNKNKDIRELSKIIVSGMLDSKADYYRDVYPIIFKWFRSTDNIEVNKGIIQALAGNYCADKQIECYNSCIELIENRNTKTSLDEIGLWTLAYYWYCSDPSNNPGQQWKQIYCKKLADHFPDILQPEKMDLYLTEYCNTLTINRIDVENFINYCEEEENENG